MFGRTIIAILSLLVISAFDFGKSARILSICPTVSISHQVVFRSFAIALNKRGHELVVVTSDPLNDWNLKNYTEIDFNYLYEAPNWFHFDFAQNRGEKNPHVSFREIAPLLHIQTEKMLDHPEMRKLYAPSSNETFDLILLEIGLWHAFLPLGVRFNAPIIGITTLGLPLNTHYGIGNPILPSHPSHWELGNKIFGSLVPWQRLDNFITAWDNIHWFESEYIPKQEAIAKKYFGTDIPSLHELHKNVSLIFANQQLPISWVRPNLPNIIEINGFHVSKQVKPLPEDLKILLDEARQGFVYMSLGSNVKSKMLSAKLRGEFVAAFSKLPYKVIWKFEDDNFPDKPDNVVILKWTPQEAILAHPNIKVFIYQGGLQSTEEAISHAVPLIGLPVMGDQDMQVDKMVDVGVAIKLEITTINRHDLSEAINTIVTDDSYKQRMLNLQSLLKDRPYNLLENAVWWTEHVIRHRGAPYLRSSFADLPWYQRGDMDIIAFLSAGAVIIISFVLVVLSKLLHKIISVMLMQSYNEKMKVN